MKSINLKTRQALLLIICLLFCVHIKAAKIYHMPIRDVSVDPGDFIEVIYNILEDKEILCDSNFANDSDNNKVKKQQPILTYYNQKGMHDAKLPLHLTLGSGQELDASGILWISNYQNNVECNVSCDYAKIHKEK